MGTVNAKRSKALRRVFANLNSAQKGLNACMIPVHTIPVQVMENALSTIGELNAFAIPATTTPADRTPVSVIPIPTGQVKR